MAPGVDRSSPVAPVVAPVACSSPVAAAPVAPVDRLSLVAPVDRACGSCRLLVSSGSSSSNAAKS